ncbi:MAG: TraR/DksA family transcriptional regulator [Gallionellaceae bacterium]|nr:TraR/DksA family transcriptional regulator [Gallionellaceae bacterium]
MADDIDRAQEREQELRQDALDDVRRRARAAGKGAKTCRECGERIPTARRKAVPGTELCVECQEKKERYRGR